MAPNGLGSRQCKDGWIEAFVRHTEDIEAPEAYRRWGAIATIAAVLEQKVYLQTSAPLYPNMFVFLVGQPGVGKTRTIHAASAFLRDIADFHLAPTSMTAASLVDVLLASKRTLIRLPDPAIEYNTLTIMADELSAFMHEYDKQIVGNLTTFYDVVIPYGHQRRGKEIKIKIQSPQVSILAGTQPSFLLRFLPEAAWEQGFMTRVMMVFSDEHIVSDDMFAFEKHGLPQEMVHDLKIINGLYGEFGVTVDYKTAINNWRKLGQPPAPTHPKLLHYATRRLAHLFKLSMVSCVDRSNALLLTKDDFNRAMGWIIDAEAMMPEVFKAGAIGADSKAMDEIIHYCTVLDTGHGVPEPTLVRQARRLVPAMSVLRIIEVMERGGMIRVAGSSSGVKLYKAVKHEV